MGHRPRRGGKDEKRKESGGGADAIKGSRQQPHSSNPFERYAPGYNPREKKVHGGKHHKITSILNYDPKQPRRGGGMNRQNAIPAVNVGGSVGLRIPERNENIPGGGSERKQSNRRRDVPEEGKGEGHYLWANLLPGDCNHGE